MESRKLSFLNISLIAALIVSGIFAWNMTRNAGLNGVTFQASRELVVYPDKRG